MNGSLNSRDNHSSGFQQMAASVAMQSQQKKLHIEQQHVESQGPFDEGEAQILQDQTLQHKDLSKSKTADSGVNNGASKSIHSSTLNTARSSKLSSHRSKKSSKTDMFR